MTLIHMSKTQLKGVPIAPQEWNRILAEVMRKNKVVLAKLAKL